MLKSACIAVTAFLFTLTPVMAANPAPIAANTAATVPTRNDVIAKVNKAIEFYRQYGREKTLAELNRHDGAFAKGMDYVDVHDLNGVCVAHPRSPDIVGSSRLDTVDIKGKHFIKEIIDAARTHPDGWVSYMKENPNNGKIEHKIAYWEVHDGLIFKAGTYDSAS
jgi:signal transduction histidine kinase